MRANPGRRAAHGSFSEISSIFTTKYQTRKSANALEINNLTYLASCGGGQKGKFTFKESLVDYHAG